MSFLNQSIPDFSFHIGTTDFSSYVTKLVWKLPHVEIAIPQSATLEFELALPIGQNPNTLDKRYNPNLIKRAVHVTLSIKGHLLFTGWIKSYRFNPYQDPKGSGIAEDTIGLINFERASKKLTTIEIGTIGTPMFNVVNELLILALSDVAITYGVPPLTGHLGIPTSSKNPMMDAQKYVSADGYWYYCAPAGDLVWKYYPVAATPADVLFQRDLDGVLTINPDFTLSDSDTETFVVSGSHDIARDNGIALTNPANPSVQVSRGLYKSVISGYTGTEPSTPPILKMVRNFYKESKLDLDTIFGVVGVTEASETWELVGAYDPAATNATELFLTRREIKAKSGNTLYQHPAAYTGGAVAVSISSASTPAAVLASTAFDGTVVQSQASSKITPEITRIKDAPSAPPYSHDTESFTSVVFISKGISPFLSQTTTISVPYVYNQSQINTLAQFYAGLYTQESNALLVEMPIPDEWLAAPEPFQPCRIGDVYGIIIAPEIRIESGSAKFIFSLYPYAYIDNTDSSIRPYGTMANSISGTGLRLSPTLNLP